MHRDTRLGSLFFAAAALGVPVAIAGAVVRDGGRSPAPLAGMLRMAHGMVTEERGLALVERHADALRTAAAEHDVSPHLLGGIMFAESRGRSGQVSAAGALGLMQLVPGAARDAARRAGLEVPSDDEALRQVLLKDEALNVRLGAAHLAWLLEHRGRWSLEAVLVSYNAGRAKLFRWIDRHGSYEGWVLSEETARARGDRTTGALAYARQVLRARDALRERAVL
ncbi:MAG: transglycosylase SLT domain-containing protein [Planctomycetota bacterium]